MDITVMLQWARWRLTSPASRLFTQPFSQAQINENTKANASLTSVRGIHRWPVNSPHKGPVTRKMFPFDDVLMKYENIVDCDCSGKEHSQNFGTIIQNFDPYVNG